MVRLRLLFSLRHKNNRMRWPVRRNAGRAPYHNLVNGAFRVMRRNRRTWGAANRPILLQKARDHNLGR
jgi:hypothetical protein